MKTRFRRLTRGQKAIILATALLTLVFTVIYAVGFSRTGIWYCGGFLTHAQHQGETTYTGWADDARLTVTVDSNKAIYTQWGDAARGPYTVREDPTALPPEPLDGMVGVEVREGANVLFRGGWLSAGDTEAAMDQSGKLYIPSPVPYNQPSPRELDFQDILRLWSGPELTRRAGIGWYLFGLFIAALGVLSLLFAEELFRWNLSWVVRDPSGVEPTDWALTRRTAGAMGFTLLAILCWLIGLIHQ